MHTCPLAQSHFPAIFQAEVDISDLGTKSGGYVGTLTSEQEIKLQQFKDAVKDIPSKPDNSNHYYLRWLRAKNFDVHKAELMFRNVCQSNKGIVQ